LEIATWKGIFSLLLANSGDYEFKGAIMYVMGKIVLFNTKGGGEGIHLSFKLYIDSERETGNTQAGHPLCLNIITIQI